MNPWDRVALYRQRAADMEKKSADARTQETKRAYLIIANEWRKMATGLELKFLEASEARLVPEARVSPVLESVSVGRAD